MAVWELIQGLDPEVIVYPDGTISFNQAASQFMRLANKTWLELFWDSTVPRLGFRSRHAPSSDSLRLRQVDGTLVIDAFEHLDPLGVLPANNPRSRVPQAPDPFDPVVPNNKLGVYWIE